MALDIMQSKMFVLLSESVFYEMSQIAVCYPRQCSALQRKCTVLFCLYYCFILHLWGCLVGFIALMSGPLSSAVAMFHRFLKPSSYYYLPLVLG